MSPFKISLKISQRGMDLYTYEHLVKDESTALRYLRRKSWLKTPQILVQKR